MEKDQKTNSETQGEDTKKINTEELERNAQPETSKNKEQIKYIGL